MGRRVDPGGYDCRQGLGFKAFGVDTSIGKLALRLAVFRATDTCNVAQYIAEPAPEDVAFVLWHPQRFLDSVGEAIACESEVFEHEQWIFIRR